MFFDFFILAGDEESDCDHCLIVLLEYFVFCKQMLKMQNVFVFLKNEIDLCVT